MEGDVFVAGGVRASDGRDEGGFDVLFEIAEVLHDWRFEADEMPSNHMCCDMAMPMLLFQRPHGHFLEVQTREASADRGTARSFPTRISSG